MPKVSFILPAYKRRFLHEAIASILAQKTRSSDRSFRDAHSLSDSTVPDFDFELVVVDDCSPEDLKPVVDEFLDDRLTYHRNEKNIGGKDLVAAWNHAMEYARGEWCVLASDDDVYHPEFAAKLIALTEKYPKVDLVHCRIAGMDSDRNWHWIGAPRAEFETGIEMLYNCGVKRYDQRIGDLMIRTSALRKAGGYVWFPRAWYSDHASAIYFSLANGAACAAETLFFWRSSGVNISTQHTDADEKLRAHAMYRKWVWDLVGSLKPVTEQDVQILRFVKEEIDGSIDGVSRWILDSLPFHSWCGAIRRAEMPTKVKLKLVYRKLGSLLGPLAWYHRIARCMGAEVQSSKFRV